MALTLSIDLEDATFADLTAAISAARAAGINPQSKVSLAGTVLQVTVEDPGNALHSMRDDERSRHASSGDTSDEVRHRARENGKVGNEAGRAGRSPVGPVGEAAVKSVIDILTGNQEPPRHSPRRFGHFDAWENED